MNIVIADDHSVVRRGLQQIIGTQPAWKIVAEITNADGVLPALRETSADLLVLDVALGGRSGIDLLANIRSEFPALPVLMLSMYHEEQYAIPSLRAGATGYIQKDSTPEELIEAMRRVGTGRRYFSGAVAEQLAAEVLEGRSGAPHERLSGRELEVFRLLASGKAVGEIAAMLHLSVKTEQTRRGARLTTQILRYTNPAEPLFETFDLGAWVRSFDDEWKNLVQDRSLRVDAGEPLVVRADPMQLHQIVTNLLVNARDATPAGGAIRIGAARATSYSVITRTVPDAERFATLYVRDNGCGIEPAVQERLFEPLFTTKRHGGTGLGLAVAHQIVTDHGGRMLVESEPGRGACFHVVLPTSREA